MNTKAERIAAFYYRMGRLGFTCEEAAALRRIEMTLHRWHERECGTDGGCIEREEVFGKAIGRPYWLDSTTRRRTPVPDRETGAEKRLHKLISEFNSRMGEGGSVAYYVQTDPRGCALYLVPDKDLLPGVPLDSQYSRGYAVCY